MAPDLVRVTAKRKQGDPECATRPAKQRKSAEFTHISRLDATDERDIHLTRSLLLRLFNAIEATIISSRSLCSFHSIQQAVTSTARTNFDLTHLSQIMGVWPEAYIIETTMALVQDIRVPSLSISRPPVGVDRRETFSKHLQCWHGASASLPELQVHSRILINPAKIASMKKPCHREIEIGVKAQTPLSARDRTSALVERLRTKAQNRATEATPESMKLATLTALIPSAIESIKVLLASRTKKVIGMTELKDNLATSLSQRVSRDEVERIMELISQSEEYKGWCKIGSVGDVKLARFVGLAPGSSANIFL